MSYRSVKLSQGMLTQLVNKEEQTFIASSFIVISYSLFHFSISSQFILYPTPCLPQLLIKLRKLRKYPQKELNTYLQKCRILNRKNSS